MAHPRFSILIPTRQRPRTLDAALRSVLTQPFTNYEVVVMDNAGGPETAAVVRAWTDMSPDARDHLRYHRSDSLLPMNDNWERGLSHCTGDYMFVLGDDDALLPDGLVLADQILRRLDVELLHWDKYDYWWDDALQPRLRGRMFLHQEHQVHLLDGHQVLADFYAWRAPFSALPCVYSSFVHRDLIARVRRHAGGRYFGVASPDIFSGIANAYLLERGAHARRGLSLAGYSGQSTGTAHQFRSLGENRQNTYWQEEGRPRKEALHPALVDTPNLEIAVADSHFRAKEILFPSDQRFVPRISGLIAAMMAGMARDPDSADKTIADIRALCAKHAIDFNALTMPARPAQLPRPQQGIVFNEGTDQPVVVVNCTQAGITDAAQAARLAAGLLPHVSYADA